MTRTGLRCLLLSYSFGHRGGSPGLQQRQRLSDAMMEDHVAAVEAAISKWESDVVLFSDERRVEARAFLADVSSLQHAMLLLVSGTGAAGSSSSTYHAALVRAQSVMQATMRRLEKEFHRILANNRHSLYPKAISVRSSSRSNASEDGEGDSVGGGGAEDSAGEVELTAAPVMAELRPIAETMVSAGYSKACVKVYKLLRKSVVDEGLRLLEFDQIAPNSHIHKLDWAALEIKIRSWLLVASAAVSSLFSGERILLDHVFAVRDSIRESIFGDISGDSAAQLLRFPEAVAKRSMEKMTRLLDLYDTVSELLLEVDSVFSFESTAPVRDQALASLSKLGEAIHATIVDFETALQTEHLTALFPGGGVHPLTRRTMECIAVLADYETTLTKIFDDSHTAVPLSPLIDEHGERSEEARRLAWLMLTLLCKLEAKAATYRHAALMHLFLANNFQCVANMAQACSLRGVLREEWAAQHEAKARHHAERYEQEAWGKVAELFRRGRCCRRKRGSGFGCSARSWRRRAPLRLGGWWRTPG